MSEKNESTLFRKKPVVIPASQWFKNGDHPQDYSKTHDGLENGELRQFPPEERRANGWEGDVVRYYRRPDDSGDRTCQHCGKTMLFHGWIDTMEGGHIVCPGDWIITGVQGEHYPCKPDIFAATYEPAGSPASVAQGGAQEAIKLVHLAVAEDGGVRFLTGRKLPAGIESCELYAMPDYGRAPAALFRAPAVADERQAVAYLDLGAGGYMDVGTDLTDEQLAALPKGRHMLAIIGTHGVDGYSPAALASAPVSEPETMEEIHRQERERAPWILPKDPTLPANATVVDADAIIRDVCELDPAAEGPETVSVTVADLRRIIERHSAPVAGEARPVRWLHTLHYETGDTSEIIDDSPDSPFGTPGVDYSDTYRVTSEPLYAAPQASEAVLQTILHSVRQARIAGNDWRRELALIENTVSAALSAQPGAQRTGGSE